MLRDSAAGSGLHKRLWQRGAASLMGVPKLTSLVEKIVMPFAFEIHILELRLTFEKVAREVSAGAPPPPRHLKFERLRLGRRLAPLPLRRGTLARLLVPAPSRLELARRSPSLRVQ